MWHGVACRPAVRPSVPPRPASKGDPDGHANRDGSDQVSAKELKAGAYTASELHEGAAGYTADELRGAAYTPEALKAGGYLAKELKQKAKACKNLCVEWE